MWRPISRLSAHCDSHCHSHDCPSVSLYLLSLISLEPLSSPVTSFQPAASLLPLPPPIISIHPHLSSHPSPVESSIHPHLCSHPSPVESSIHPHLSSHPSPVESSIHPHLSSHPSPVESSCGRHRRVARPSDAAQGAGKSVSQSGKYDSMPVHRGPLCRVHLSRRHTNVCLSDDNLTCSDE